VTAPLLLTPAEAIARAVAAAGSDDFGPPGIEAGLARTLDAFSRVPLTSAATQEVNARLVRDLANRLAVEAWYAAHPETAQQTIDSPVILVGMPRTGTTATVAMLALDDRLRFLRGWEAGAPVPPPIAGEEESDPRLIAAREAAKTYAMAHLHLFDPDGPEEDLALLAGLDMHAFHGAYPMPDDYLAWWKTADFRSCYAYIARVLKLLQSRRGPNRWLLKSPPHLFRIDRLAELYPDARFVMTHRDPRKLIASVASLHVHLFEERCRPGSIDKAKVGRTVLAFWREGIRRGLAARAAIGEDRFIDVDNGDVVSRPVAVFERIYDHIGLPLTPALVRRLEDYNANNAPGRFGAHRYTLEEYGLDEAEVRSAFAEYIDRFGLDRAA
jgi:hypothetical protein